MRRMLVMTALLLGLGTVEAQPPARDSTGTAAAARRAQRRFESVRRANLPFHDRVATPACDARIGRYCFWYDSTDRLPQPREHERVTTARRALLATLDSLAAHSPADRVIFAQRVMYRLEAGDTSAALAVAATCRTAPWWCSALRGYVLHATGDFDGASTAFDAALATMDSVRRCTWSDISVLLPPRTRRSMKSLPCEARTARAERIWWLADPRLVTAANDLRTEYLARRTAAALEDDGIALFGGRWNDDEEEMMLRYGLPVWWSRERPVTLAATTGPPAITGHEAVPSHAFLPRRALLDDTLAVPTPGDWALDEATPTMRYAPGYATVWRPVAAQVARFRRGDTLLIVAAHDAAADTMLHGGIARIALSPGPRRIPIVSDAREASAGSVALRVPTEAIGRVALLDVEVVDSARLAIGRHRMGITPLRDDAIALSDLLVHRPAPGDEHPPRTAEEVVPLALPGDVVRDDRVGIYWEAYCRRPLAAPLAVTLELVRLDRSVLRRLGARLGFDDPSDALRIDWRDAPGGSGRCAARSMVLDLGDLPAGRYDVRLRVEGKGATATATRRISLRR